MVWIKAIQCVIMCFFSRDESDPGSVLCTFPGGFLHHIFFLPGLSWLSILKLTADALQLLLGYPPTEPPINCLHLKQLSVDTACVWTFFLLPFYCCQYSILLLLSNDPPSLPHYIPRFSGVSSLLEPIKSLPQLAALLKQQHSLNTIMFIYLHLLDLCQGPCHWVWRKEVCMTHQLPHCSLAMKAFSY